MSAHVQLNQLIVKVQRALREGDFANHVAGIASLSGIRIVPKRRSALFALPSHRQNAY